jgi:hypothetical protein
VEQTTGDAAERLIARKFTPGGAPIATTQADANVFRYAGDNGLFIFPSGGNELVLRFPVSFYQAPDLEFGLHRIYPRSRLIGLSPTRAAADSTNIIIRHAQNKDRWEIQVSASAQDGENFLNLAPLLRAGAYGLSHAAALYEFSNDNETQRSKWADGRYTIAWSELIDRGTDIKVAQDFGTAPGEYKAVLTWTFVSAPIG